ncbi:MAG TPA: hypothetical protein PLR50_07930, partial [Candidatus Rifleibacterium sp.]|nr:hypothetical protein [Candidatus Rifleibacterium sp.]
FIFILPSIVLGQFLIVQYGKSMFRTEPLDLATWLIIIASTSLVLWIGEFFRLFTSDRTPVTGTNDQNPFEAD